MEREELTIIQHIGKGKSGNSYLAQYKTENVVLKEMHDEQVLYYHFEKSKIEHEIISYDKLQKIDVKLPKLISYSLSGNYLIKEYIEGKQPVRRSATMS